MFDPRTLQALVAVRRTGSISGAAEQLGYTPSAVSQQIKRLESQMATPLLERVGRGVVLTPAASVLVDEAHELLAGIERVETRMREASGRVHGSVRLGAFSTAVRGLLPEALRGLREGAPDLHVEVRELDPWDAIDAVGAGTLEAAIVHNWEPLPLRIRGNVRRVDLGMDEAYVVMSARHPLAGRTALDAADLVGQDWIAVRPGSICYQWLTTMLRNAGGEPRVIHEIAEYEAQLALVRPTGALALIPRLGRGVLPEGVVSRPVWQRSRRKVLVIFRESHVASPAIVALVAALRAASAAALVPTDADTSELRLE